MAPLQPLVTMVTHMGVELKSQAAANRTKTSLINIPAVVSVVVLLLTFLWDIHGLKSSEWFFERGRVWKALPEVLLLLYCLWWHGKWRMQGKLKKPLR